ncbi:hypothetical protein K523DRAFT_144949 [Schizophyllum commune Tattone D]|nr:hypothetical protein K523DRAFT_144949 [Schizophyllum commune Tattone D]
MGYPSVPLPPSPIQRLSPAIALDQHVIADTDKSSLLECDLGPTLFPTSLFCMTANVIINLINKSFYNLSDRKWIYYPLFFTFPDCAKRACATADFFTKFTRICWLFYAKKRYPLPSAARRWYVTESPRLRSNGSTVTSYGMALAEDGPGDLQWRNVLCDVQIEEAAENMQVAIERLATGAAQVFATQEHRLFHLGLALAGDTYQLAYYDRAGRVLSGTYNVHEDAALFARVIMGLTLLDKSFLGIDPTIIFRDDRRFLKVCTYEFEILRTISINANILGRGTVCWLCRRAGSKEDYVIKNVWVDEQTGHREGMFLKRARLIEGIPDLVCEEVVSRPDGEPWTTTWVRQSHQGTDSATVSRPAPCLVLRRLVLQPYARPLRDFSSKDELLELLKDAIEAHQDLYIDADALHCDISENNIMAHEPAHSSRRQGLLIDLDGALHVGGKHKVGPMGCTRGTLPYMAIEILQYPNLVEHAPWHDLESFLYVLMIICATYSGPSNTPRHGFDIHKSRLGPWFSGDGVYKADIMRGYDDAKFRAFLDEVFDPYFDDLKDVVCDLRNIITRQKDACPSHVDVMIVIGKHIRARQASQKRAAAAAQCPPAAVETKRSERAKRKRVTAAAPAPPAPRPAAPGKSRRMTTRSKAQASPPRTPSPASDDSEGTVVLTPPRRQTRAATKCAQSNKQAELGVGMAGATRAAKRRRME